MQHKNLIYNIFNDLQNNQQKAETLHGYSLSRSGDNILITGYWVQDTWKNCQKCNSQVYIPPTQAPI